MQRAEFPYRPRLACAGWDASVAPGNSLLGAFRSLELASFHHVYTPTPGEFLIGSCTCFRSLGASGEKLETDWFLRGLHRHFPCLRFRVLS